jgi:TRAP-type C4-dicarboxylate transport system substrate-binding protein
VKRIKIFLAVGLFITILAVPLSALTIKMGTLVPPGSSWDLSLKKLAADWAKISKGRVVLKIYGGGRAGDEPDMLRKLRFNQLQAVGLTMVGLSQVFGGIMAPAVPLMIQDPDELLYVLDRMKPVIEREFEKKGFKVLFWNMAGWGHFFSRHPVVYPDDLRNQRIFIMEGNPKEAEAWKQLGFKAVTFTMMDMLIQLQSGGVDVFVSNPIMAAANQWFGVANNMTAFRWAPIYGAFVISKKTWNRIPKEFHEGMLNAAQRCAAGMDVETLKANNEAVEIMKKYGLKINDIPQDAVDEWKGFIKKGLDLFVGGRFDIKYFYQAEEYVNEYKRLHGRN